MSVIVTCVLLKVAEILAMREAMFFEPFALRICRVAASSASNSAAVGAAGALAAAAGAASGAFAGAGVSAPAGAFFGALAALFSGAALEVAVAPAASVLTSFFTTGFLDLFSSAINEFGLVNARLRIRIALHADGLARSLACARVGLGALAAHGQSAQVADAAITLDGLQPLQIQTGFAAEIAFGDIFAILDGVNDLRQLLFVQILGAEARVNIGFRQDFLRVDRPDAVDVTQRDFDAFFRRYIFSQNTWHASLLTLTLFMARVGTDDANHTFATHNFAVLAKPFH